MSTEDFIALMQQDIDFKINLIALVKGQYEVKATVINQDAIKQATEPLQATITSLTQLLQDNNIPIPTP